MTRHLHRLQRMALHGQEWSKKERRYAHLGHLVEEEHATATTSRMEQSWESRRTLMDLEYVGAWRDKNVPQMKSAFKEICAARGSARVHKMCIVKLPRMMCTF